DAGKPGQDAAAPGTAAPSAAGREESVAAVLLSGVAPAQLRFLIGTRPAVGAPFVLKLEMVAPQSEPDLQVAVGPAADFTADPAIAAVALTAATRATQEITVTPRRAGLMELPVRLRAGGEGAEAAYSIPVLVGAPAP
ncbi:MAG: hypothetical protein ABW278_00070, partial [Steroidobacteraceae bacterium]